MPKVNFYERIGLEKDPSFLDKTNQYNLNCRKALLSQAELLCNKQIGMIN